MGRRMPPPPNRTIPLRQRLAAERRVHQLLVKNKLLFCVEHGEGSVRVIPMAISDQHGAGLIGNEYDGILRAIVEAVIP